MESSDYLELVTFADLPSGPTCRRFAFATLDADRISTTEKRRRAVVGHVTGWLDLVDIVDEWSEDDRRWLVIETPSPVTVKAAESFATACPHYVAGTFAVDRSR